MMPQEGSRSQINKINIDYMTKDSTESFLLSNHVIKEKEKKKIVWEPCPA